MFLKVHQHREWGCFHWCTYYFHIATLPPGKGKTYQGLKAGKSYESYETQEGKRPSWGALGRAKWILFWNWKWGFSSLLPYLARRWRLRVLSPVLQGAAFMESSLMVAAQANLDTVTQNGTTLMNLRWLFSF